MAGSTDWNGGWGGRLHRAGQVATGVLAVALFAGACSGGSGASGAAGVASAGSKGAKSSNARSDSSRDGDPLAYSRCMRAHGVTNFPDPDPNGGISISHGNGLDPDSPQFKSADAACKAQMPHMPQAQQSKMKAAALKYAQCMRAHGLTSFPDPSSDGGIQLQVTPGSELDPNSPLYVTADKACQKLMPAGPKGGQRLDQKSAPGGAGS